MKRSQIPLSRGKPLSKGTGKLTRGSKLKRRSKTPEEKQQQSEDIEKMRQLFERHWISKWIEWFHQCESCGVTIYGENKSYYHDHLIEKSSHLELKYEIENLALVCLDCHSRKTDGNPTQRHRELIEAAKKRYNL